VPPELKGAQIEITGLSKRYAAGGVSELVALDEIDLAVGSGSFVAVVGPSGSGKSTLLHLIGAMDAADGGSIRVDSQELTRLSRSELVNYRRRIGFVFQRFHLLPALSIVDNVAAPLIPYRVPFDKRERARELLGLVGLGGRENSLPNELSGGQQQRVAIARALVNDPVLLLADEPTGNLDSQTGSEVIDLLLELRESRAMTVIIATHDSVIASRCDRIVRLLDGRVLDEVTVKPSAAPEAMLDRISRIDS